MIEFLIVCFVLWGISCLFVGGLALESGRDSDTELLRIFLLLPLLFPIWIPWITVEIIYMITCWLYQGFVRYLPWK